MIRNFVKEVKDNVCTISLMVKEFVKEVVCTNSLMVKEFVKEVACTISLMVKEFVKEIVCTISLMELSSNFSKTFIILAEPPKMDC